MRPLQTTFQVVFLYEVFHHQTAVLFPFPRPVLSQLPLWDLYAVLCLFGSVGVGPWSPILQFFSTLFHPALAMGDRCTGLEHFSRQSIVASGLSLTLGVEPRLCTPCNLARLTRGLFHPSVRQLPSPGFDPPHFLGQPPWFLRFALPSSGTRLVAGRLPSYVVCAVLAASIPRSPVPPCC